MISENYVNYEKVKEIEQQIKAIDSSLRINGYGLRDNRITDVMVYILEKGNKSIINELIKIGFEKSFREKIHDDPHYPKYDGYSFRLCMTMNVR